MTSPTDDRPWTQKLLDQLSDGEWHDYKTLIKEVSLVVPEDLALEKAEYYRSRHYLKAGNPVAERTHGDVTNTIKTGQRLVLSRAIQSLSRRNRVEVEYSNENPKRRKPERIRLIA